MRLMLRYLLSRFLIDRNNVELYPDALPALQALSQQYPLVALTDGNSDLESIGIRKYFVGAVYAIDVGFTKPHPAGFLKACEIAGTNPAKTIHVGDSPTADIAGAHGAGLHSMWVRRNGEEWARRVYTKLHRYYINRSGRNSLLTEAHTTCSGNRNVLHFVIRFKLTPFYYKDLVIFHPHGATKIL